jgi:hypothetical protein
MRICGPEQCGSNSVVFGIGYLNSDTVIFFKLSVPITGVEGVQVISKIPFHSLMLLPFSTCHLFDISLYLFSSAC